MEKHILAYCKEQKQKKKTGNIRVTYEELLWQAAGQDERRQSEIQTEHLGEFQRLLEELVQKKVLKPIKNSRKIGFTEHVYGKYSIVGEPAKRETNPEFITLLHSYIGTKVFEYYHYKKAEFEKDREIVDIIYNYYKKSHKIWLTSNELGYYLFQDEKAFEQPEKGNGRKEKIGKSTVVLKKMGIELEKDLHARYTKEPFFCQIRESFFEREQRKVLIVENKDSYFRLKNHEITKEYDCVIYGEGWKIVSSFSLADETGILKTDKIDYFGDMDPEGFVIYQSLKENYPEYEINLQTEFYEKTIDAVGSRPLQKVKGIVRTETLQTALEITNVFDEHTAAYLKKMMQNECYIPQEAIVLALFELPE